jgi:hypothetical protein
MAKGISLHIGLNSVDPNHYDGWEGTLLACEADAQDMEMIAEKEGFAERIVFLTKEASFNRVVKELERIGGSIEAGDLFMLTYSGHGGQVQDLNRDENDLADETWCLYDRQLVDDHIYKLLGGFREGVRIIMLSDSCHSGSVARAALRGETPGVVRGGGYRAMPPNVAYRVYRKNQALYDATAITENFETTVGAVKASVILISGCQDNQLSSDGTFNGLFTGTLLQVWQGGRFQGSYRSLHRQVLRLMPRDQSPEFFTVGAHNPAFAQQRPFTIAPSVT